uniref:RNA-dependent RNA polymerase n=1 Tax=Panagrolaimus sp. JU765 TaxID=591449 RepID=A0AC34Q7I0_9BILA
MVQADALMNLKFIDEKKQVRVPKHLGRTTIGAADFNGFLKPGEVFFQYTEKLDPKCPSKIVHVGPVAIIRSPMYSLGDLRFVKAVDCEELHNLVDVLIFPTVGGRPIQDQISGGDLDGDEYVVFWDPDLMLPFSQPPAEFVHPEPDESSKVTVNEIQAKFPIFREKYMREDMVGNASNNHAILAELCGYDNEQVVELAAKIDISLLYFKNGIQAKPLVQHEMSAFDPDHMMKDQKPAFSLNNVIGNFHRDCRTIMEEILEVKEQDQSSPVLDPLIEFPGWEEWKNEAQTSLDAFKTQVDVLMLENNLNSIGELGVLQSRIRRWEISSFSMDIMGCLGQC